jgi:hypothetical protein
MFDAMTEESSHNVPVLSDDGCNFRRHLSVELYHVSVSSTENTIEGVMQTDSFDYIIIATVQSRLRSR